MPSVTDATEELLEIYKRALKRHLLSDVPVGLLLSGGVDSGMLLALMNLHGGAWNTYTVGYGSTFADDELTLAAETARIFGSNHASIELGPDAFSDALPKVIEAVEEPIAASSIVPMYFVCQRARQDVKVVLLGQGPDELFGGYRRHLGLRYSRCWSAVPDWLRPSLAGAIGLLPRNEMLKRGAYSLHVKDRLHRYARILSLVPDGTVISLFRDDVLTVDTEEFFLACLDGLPDMMANSDDLGGFQLLELRSTLPDELLLYGDKLSMAHGLEARVPFLDREIVEWVERLDASFKIRHLVRKWLHKRVCGRFLPRTMLRRRKRGFAVNVVDGWLRDGRQAGMRDLLLDPSSLMFEFLRPDTVAGLLREHVRREHDNHKILFSLVALEHWLRSRSALTKAAPQ